MTEATGPEPGSSTSLRGDDSLSILGQLRSRREQVVEAAHKDLRVPRWGEPGTGTPEIYVRYRPVDHKIIRKAMEVGDNTKAKGDKRAAAEVRANIDVLIAGCVGVFGVVDGEQYSLRPGDPKGEWTGFDQDLAENLGCGQSATEVIRSLYITDGDIISTASAVAEFSGYQEAESYEAIRGE